MKIKKGFVLRKLGPQYVVVALSGEASKLNYLIKLNDLGAYIWNLLSKDSLSTEEIINKVLEEYNASKEQVRQDVEAFINVLKEKNILENGK